VQSGQQINAEISKHHRRKSENGKKGDAPTLPTAHQAGMQQSGVNKPGNQ